ncbi:MAG TPA: hypothetical protein VGB42_00630, partial [Candidatus Thermoplasmatota archaeon]
MSRTRATALTLLFVAFACAQPDPGSAPPDPGFAPPDPELIQRADVERVITTLASDDMRGRRAFTDDAMRAADFLATEFANAGLQPMEGGTGYLQRIPVRTLTPEDVSVSVDGQAVPVDDVLLRMGTESLDWSTGDVEVVAVGADAADARGAIMGSVRGASNALVLVHPSHEAALAQLGRFFRGPVRLVGDAPGVNVAIVTVDAPADASYEVSATASLVVEPLANVVGM